MNIQNLPDPLFRFNGVPVIVKRPFWLAVSSLWGAFTWLLPAGLLAAKKWLAPTRRRA